MYLLGRADEGQGLLTAYRRARNGSGSWLSLPNAATGRPIEYGSHEFHRIADGILAEEWICSDMTTLHRQIS